MTDKEKIDKLALIADRAIFWLLQASMLDSDKENSELYERKAMQMQEELEKLK